jgi:hypothetical protein
LGQVVGLGPAQCGQPVLETPFPSKRPSRPYLSALVS